MHYCSSRRTEGPLTPKVEVSTANAIKASVGTASISPQLRAKTPTSAMVAVAAAAAAAASLPTPTPQPFLALPTNPILIIPCSLIRAASWIPGPLTSPLAALPNPDGTCYMLDNGDLKPLATALNISAFNSNATITDTILGSPAAVPFNLNTPHIPTVETSPACQPSLVSTNEPLLPENNAGRNVERSEALTPNRREGARDAAPLDLSLRRSPPSHSSLQRQRVHLTSSYADADEQMMDMETLLEAGKENLSMDETGTVTPEQIVCAPSLPNSPSMSPSPKRRALSPRSSGADSTSSMSSPVNVSTVCLVAAAAANNLLDLPLRSMLPADIALKLSETNIMNPLLSKQNLELALKLSAAAAAAVNNNSPTGASSTIAELAAATAGKSAILLPSLGTGPPASNSVNIVGPNTAVQPQIYVKQGVSKCKECNIVFCKYENYLAHKQHYCSARKQNSCEDETKVANTSPIGVGAAAGGVNTTPVAYQQLICAACGIKYSSLDNLRAHQNYYCPKGGGPMSTTSLAAAAAASESGQMPLSKDKCSKCKTIHELGQPCPPQPALQQAQSGAHHMQSANMAVTSAITGPNQNLYKCPVCDVVSLTPSESRKHMETHGTVKAFRCSICRYKGNTLRGIRTHIRMHFDKKATDLNEEHYMSCILEDEVTEIPSIASALTQDQLAQQIAVAQQQQLQLQAQQQQQQIYNCDLCNYSSSYKCNVLRHMKLVHPHININSPSISPEGNDIDTNDSATLNGENSFHDFMKSFTNSY
ncbi:zinc finger protein ush-like, partial [Rhagoletis pomonella]|uniref:zinc finger protein ush-like n=1 Tax=Rhagoletis pomonella TaxID=28610 RepID=UPI00177B8A9D